MIDSILTNTIPPKVSRELLTKLMEDDPVKAINIDVENDQFIYRFDLLSDR